MRSAPSFSNSEPITGVPMTDDVAGEGGVVAAPRARKPA